MLNEVDSRFYNRQSFVESKRQILNEYFEYVDRQVKNGHDLGRMMKHLFGLSRGDKYAKTFRIKILEVIKDKELQKHKKDLEELLIN